MRDKFLTEAMGECWHKSTKYLGENLSGWECDKCHKDAINNDFSAWEGFGKLWEWAQEQEWFASRFYMQMSFGSYVRSGYIHPDRFADALYEFLKERT